MRTLAICAALMIATAGDVLAGWQGAEWGMSAKDVQAKVKIDVVEPSPARQVSEAITGNLAKFGGAYAAGDLQFNVVLQFDKQDRLNQITLKVTDYGKCESFKSSLLLRYGGPVESKRDKYGLTLSWLDPENRNKVELFIFTDIKVCRMGYSPLDGEAAKRL